MDSFDDVDFGTSRKRSEPTGPPSVGEQALGKGLQAGGAVVSGGLGLAKVGTGKGMA
jgi:hypothetical protein